ncbi:nuclear transport factor 2 family protein [Streptomyces sp. NPDC007100]|uniref:nuclear transport factor 2 family protein n=1 Tax=Streptomyces sp. NPDC007100 TaxID=3155602 RepID=UPI0033DD262E
MTTEAVLQNAFQALASGDRGQIAAVFTADAEWLSPPGNATSIALNATHHMVGRDAIARFFSGDFPRLFARDLAVTFNHFHADGAWGVAEVTVAATLANGNHYAIDYCFVFELRGNLIHRVREYTDTARGHRMVFMGGRLCPER